MRQAFGLYISYTVRVVANSYPAQLRVNNGRLMQRLMDLAKIGSIDGGGCARLALTDEDKAGRDLVIAWMQELGLSITIDVT